MIIYETLLQGSEEWLKTRLGRATASEAGKILTPGGKTSTSRTGYLRKLIRECVVDDPMEWTGSRFTDWGNEREPEAREAFKTETGLPIDEYGFLTRDDGIIGASPDGLRLHNPVTDKDHYEPHDQDYGLEIKCPQVDTHVGYLMDGDVPDKYKLQLHWSLAASGLSAWYFMSYFPGLNPLIIRVHADEFTEKVKAAQDQLILDYAIEREKVFDAILPDRKQKPKQKETVLIPVEVAEFDLI